MHLNTNKRTSSACVCDPTLSAGEPKGQTARLHAQVSSGLGNGLWMVSSVDIQGSHHLIFITGVLLPPAKCKRLFPLTRCSTASTQAWCNPPLSNRKRPRFVEATHERRTMSMTQLSRCQPQNHTYPAKTRPKKSHHDMQAFYTVARWLNSHKAGGGRAAQDPLDPLPSQNSYQAGW